jgi:zinc transport system substrate-binding protein
MIRILFIAMLILSSCSDKKTVLLKKKVTATNYPVYWLVQQIAGDSVELHYPVPEDIDPAYWTPDDNRILTMQKSDLVLINGATYEKWLEGVTLTAGKTIDTSKDCESAFIILKDQVEHEHDGKVHSHDGTDFNIWLDAYIFSIQANTVKDALVKLNPDKKQEYETALTAMKKKLKTVFIDLNNAAKPQKNYLASHPVYNYLAKANGWKLKNFHWYMLWEDTPAKEIADRLQKEGVEIIVFRTCGNRPAAGDFFSEMAKNIENIKTALKK